MGWVKKVLGSIGLQPRAADQGVPGPGADYWYEEYAAPNAAGIKVTADSALKVAAVFRSVTILADTLSTLRLGMYKLRIPGQIDGGMDPVPNHPLNDVIAIAPNREHTPAEFWGMMVFHAALRGEAYAEIKPGPRGAVDRLVPLHPDNVKPLRAADGTPRYEVTDAVTRVRRTLLQEEIFHFCGLKEDGFRGLKNIDLASETIALLTAADQYAARVFSNNLNMGGFVTVPGKLSKEAAQNFVQRLTQRFTGAANSHRPMLLTEGGSYVQASMKANEAQLLEARKWQIGEVGRYWGIPLHMLMVDDQTNRATVEEQSINFVRYTIRPLAEKIEQAIRRDLILVPRIYVAVFNLDELERGNMAARADYLAKMTGSGGSAAILTVNEARASEGYNPSDDPDADKLAKGTNTTLAPAQQPQTDKPSDEDDRVGAVQPRSAEYVVRLGAEAMARKEVAVLRRLAVRHADDREAFRAAVRAFYGGFVSDVMRRLGVTKDQAKTWCKARSARIGGANDVAAAIDALEEEIDAEQATAPGEKSHG